MKQRIPNIRSFTLEELQVKLAEFGEPKFRAKQIYEWLWKRGAGSFDEMTNVGKGLREKLAEHFTIGKAEIEAGQRSGDGTIKYMFRLAGGQLVEGVLIPTPKRMTACVSSQAGCSLSCKFCATGFLDLKHNLHHYEIYDQVYMLNQRAMEEFGKPLSNIVYMGMGEPLLNYRNVMGSIDMVTSEAGMGMSPKRITVSTAGVAKMIKKLADDGARFEFALSLHAGNDDKRSQVMPINDSNSLEALKDALIYFYEKTHTRITLEYCIFKDVNDSIEDAKELVAFSRIVPSKINVIEYNPVPESGFQNTTNRRMDAFIQYLEQAGVIVNVRRSRGKDVDGGCGQLALKNWDETPSSIGTS
ncbi:23S rRNA (adenine(2503)-C(2))-methyltransferase RlmN [Pontibacter sp. G13]|uniref:23S rRNA (adenine(2503)-C(2))-methyltransferase RlmN n=1 Tax=Pontibacter sp. G13 TaxID=3074898 RepID=UPI00288A7C5F|nr:23S rRNA (adenine(2503)-C(2))-methyltransferase RlmN [Pontibacter sp. G13]WNJ16288.1 23S rRNA (adenine(2503)-C(2))-methyltransferase RlmN [Pontibacter sp. G13]